MMSAYKLQKALKFTDSDLNANREGKITRKQVEYLTNKRDFLGKYLVAGVVILIVILLVIRRDDNVTSDAMTIYTLMALSALCIFPMMVVSGSNILQNDIDHPQVEAIQGIVTKHAYKLSYTLHIGKNMFGVSESAYNAFENGTTYKIYYMPKSKIIVSAEKVES